MAMNIQPGRMSGSRRTTSARRDPDFGKQFIRVLKVVLFLVLVASVPVTHIYLNQRITETERKIRTLKLNINRINIEITNLRNRYEDNCSPSAIRRQIARFGLPLVPAEPGQVVAMRIMTSQEARSVAQLMLNRRSLASAERRPFRTGGLRRD